jgi:clan AA aspartic protease
MGIIYTKIELSNPVNPGLEKMEVNALVDTGAVHFCIPEHVAMQLQLKELEKREVTLADGTRKFVSYVGPLKITFKNRSSFSGALVMGQTPLLGAIAMEDMDLVIHPFLQKVDVNPESPNIPQSIVM